MAKNSLYGSDPVDHAESIASEGLANKCVLDINGETDSRVSTHVDRSLEKQIDTHQDGKERDITDMRGTE